MINLKVFMNICANVTGSTNPIPDIGQPYLAARFRTSPQMAFRNERGNNLRCSVASIRLAPQSTTDRCSEIGCRYREQLLLEILKQPTDSSKSLLRTRKLRVFVKMGPTEGGIRRDNYCVVARCY